LERAFKERASAAVILRSTSVTRYNDSMTKAREYPRVPHAEPWHAPLAIRLLARAVWLLAITVSMFAIGLFGALVLAGYLEGLPDNRVRRWFVDAFVAVTDLANPGAILLASIVAVMLVDWAGWRLILRQLPALRGTSPKSRGTKPARPASQGVKAT
jgi:hypothetical protein